jgi:hypothetical protein
MGVYLWYVWSAMLGKKWRDDEVVFKFDWIVCVEDIDTRMMDGKI